MIYIFLFQARKRYESTFYYKWFDKTHPIGLIFVILCSFLLCCICICVFCKVKKHEKDMEHINMVQRLKENNPNVFDQHPSQRSINSSQTSFLGGPSSTSEWPGSINYLPYDSSGTAYKAPCTDPHT